MIELYQGDCLEILTTVEDNSIDCVITDPPYFIDGMGDNWDTKELIKSVKKSGIIGSLPVGMKFDPQQGKKLYDFTLKYSKEIFRILKPGGFFLVCNQPRLITSFCMCY